MQRKSSSTLILMSCLVLGAQPCRDAGADEKPAGEKIDAV